MLKKGIFPGIFPQNGFLKKGFPFNPDKDEVDDIENLVLGELLVDDDGDMAIINEDALKKQDNDR